MDVYRPSTTHLRVLPRRFYQASVLSVARDLLGTYLVRTVATRDRQEPGSGIEYRLVARIVETEAYHESEPASHSYRGIRPRTEVMFGDPGHAYVYFIYGMHYCFNVVCEASGIGSAVLIRAVEPMHGEAVMRSRRPAARRPQELTNGPAKLAQAFGITRDRDNGKDLVSSDIRICAYRDEPAHSVNRTGRIGITKARDLDWRFTIAGNPYVSKKRTR